MGDVDKRITDILSKMLEKTTGQVLTAAVAIKVLETKFKEAFGGLNFEEKKPLIEKFLAEKQKEKVQSTGKKKKADSSSSDDDSDSDSSSGSDDSSDEEEEDEEDDESVFDDSADEDEEEEEPAAKKLRSEILTGDVGVRVDAMLTCARKVGYRPKAIVTTGEAAQTPEAYLNTYLIPFFESKGMDPTKFGEADIKRYRKIKEVSELERDGANLNLDRASRRGRGVVAPAAPAAPKPTFMDDE